MYLLPKDYELLRRYHGIEPEDADLLSDDEVEEKFLVISETMRQIKENDDE